MMRNQVLKLYKDILKYGQTLKYTDKDYYKERVRKDFKKNKDLTDKEAIEFQLQKAENFLKIKRVV